MAKRDGVHMISDGRGGALPLARVQAKVRAHEGGALIAAAGAASVDVERIIAAYVESDTVYFLDHLYREIQRQVDQASFHATLDIGVPGIDVQHTGPFAEGLSQQFNVSVETNKVNAHAAKIAFSAPFAIRLAANHVGAWTIGMVQTVLSADKQIVLRKQNGEEFTAHMVLPAPANDCGDIAVQPWYHQLARHQLDMEFQQVDIRLIDGPGFWIGKAADEELHSLSGTDKFATWLALRRDADGHIVWLYRWDWRIDYTNDGGAVTLTAQGWFPDGSAAVLSGEPAITSNVVTKTITAAPEEQEEQEEHADQQYDGDDVGDCVVS